MQNRDDLDNLLLWLAAGAGSGPRQYVETRRKLVALFNLWGAQNADDLADETLDRAARAIRKPAFISEGSPIAYLRGVARNVYLESRRRDRTVSQEAFPEFADPAAHSASEASRTEQLHACLDCCLARLPENKCNLLLRYYLGDKSAKIDMRMRLGQELNIELNTLRLQIFRLRNIVRKCVQTCIRATEMNSAF